ncbi:septum formation initiator family protein [Bacillus salitolerans]|uniref:Septum formation initiator family protein n=1 Tax=Bacillus salitolerans TaxID=1437434 RepID=A0ABW4LPW7_9BACI
MNAMKREKHKQIQSDYQKVVVEKEKLVLHRRRGLVRRLTVFGIVVSIVSFFMITTFLSQNEALGHKLEQRNKLQAELQKMETKQTRLEEEIVKLNDDEYIAKIARRDYFLSNENEIIFSIPEDDTGN